MSLIYLESRVLLTFLSVSYQNQDWSGRKRP